MQCEAKSATTGERFCEREATQAAVVVVPAEDAEQVGPQYPGNITFGFTLRCCDLHAMQQVPVDHIDEHAQFAAQEALDFVKGGSAAPLDWSRARYVWSPVGG